MLRGLAPAVLLLLCLSSSPSSAWIVSCSARCRCRPRPFLCHRATAVIGTGSERARAQWELRAGLHVTSQEELNVWLSLAFPDEALSIAAVRCTAFKGGVQDPQFQHNCKDLSATTKVRMELGATVITARVEEPLSLVLGLLGRSPELCTGGDDEALRKKEELEQRIAKHGLREAGEHGAVTILREWWESRGGRGPIVGAVDLSTHEFDRSEVWIRTRGRGRDAYISDMAVHPSFSGHGIGARLVQASIDLAKAQGFREVHLHVEEGNACARRLYHRAGFALAPEDEAVKDFARALLFDPAANNKHMSKVL